MLPGTTVVDTLQVDPSRLDSAATSPAIGGYDALQRSGRRRAHPVRVVGEDTLLRYGRRTELQASGQDLARNYSIAGWMIRRHLDYVASFTFHSRNADARRIDLDRGQLEDLDRTIERLMREDATRRRCDAGGRFRRERIFRIAEGLRITGGDNALLKLNNGTLQGIEADLIRNPTHSSKDYRQYADRGDWVDGFLVGPAGRITHAALHRRKAVAGGYELQRVVPSSRLIVHGHYERYADSQTRGVSPIASALNSMRSTYEGIDMMSARLKIDQLFALAIYRESADEIGDLSASDDEAEDATDYSASVDFSGPQLLDLDPGDKAEFLSNSNPSQQAQAFLHLTIGVSLKALDIPFSFYDESFTNFFGSRAAWMHYERSCLQKRDDQVEMRDDYTLFKMRQWIRDGRLVLPPGVGIDSLAWEWVPLGMPWWDPGKEIAGDKEAIAGGFDNPQRISKARGKGDFADNVRATCRAMADARRIAEEELGDADAFRLDFGKSTQGSTDRPMDPVEAIQKIYLGVGSVITAAEAREILRREHGLDLDPDVDPTDAGADDTENQEGDS